jgi:hypothetical protein
MENSPAFEEAIKFSAKGIFDEKTTKPKDAEVNKETVELFEQIDPEKPAESVKAIESLIDRIGKDEALTLEQVKTLGREISKLEKKFEDDVKKYDEDFKKFPLWVRASALFRNFVDLNVWLKNEDLTKANELREKLDLAESSADKLGEEKFLLEDKINEVIIVESAKAVPEFKKELDETQKVTDILTELNFLVSYTEGQNTYGSNIAIRSNRSVSEMLLLNLVDGVKNDKVNKSVERLRQLMEEERGILETRPTFDFFSKLAATNPQTELIGAMSNIETGISKQNESYIKNEELKTLQKEFQTRLEAITATTNDVVLKVRKDLGLKEPVGKRFVKEEKIPLNK